LSISVIIGIIIGFVSLIVAFILEGGHVGALLEPTAAMIVFGGTIGAVIIATPMDDLKRIGGIFKTVFKKRRSVDTVYLINYFKDLAVKSRKEGLLSIEKDAAQAAEIDPFISKGLGLVVDGVDPQSIRGILENDIYLTFERHKGGIAIFEDAGGFAPTMGIIGTVMGLVHVLGNLEDPKSLGPKIAVAFIATLYGVGTANLLWLPIGKYLKSINKKESEEKQLMVEAILAIQEGLNPNLLEERLKSFLSSAEAEKAYPGEERTSK
jgi:chemotaxis protein MotA